MLDSPEPSVEEVSHKTLQCPLSLISRKSACPAPGCPFALSCSLARSCHHLTSTIGGVFDLLFLSGSEIQEKSIINIYFTRK